jgi:hypothetical protein
VVDSLLDDVERLRGLRPRWRVPAYVQDDAGLAEFLAERVKDSAEDRNAAARSPAERVLQAFGLLGPDERLLALARSAYQGSLAAYYDLERGYVVLRPLAARQLTDGDTLRRRASRAVTVHELVHAVAVQRLGLGSLRKWAERQDLDRRFGVEALAEGDATLAQLQYLAEPRGVRVSHLPLSYLIRSGALRPGHRESAPASSKPAAASSNPAVTSSNRAATATREPPVPLAVRELLESPYLDGLVLAAALMRSGGSPLLDRAYRRPPTSSEQVLHPEKYLAGEQGIELRVPPRPGQPAALIEGTLGEMGIRTLLRVARVAGAERAASGWGGDHYRLMAGPMVAGPSGPVHHDTLAWITVWDDERAARRFHRAMLKVQAHRTPPDSPRPVIGPTSRCQRLDRGTAVAGNHECLVHHGLRVALVRGRAVTLAEAEALLDHWLLRAVEIRRPADPPFPGVSYVPEPPVPAAPPTAPPPVPPAAVTGPRRYY